MPCRGLGQQCALFARDQLASCDAYAGNYGNLPKAAIGCQFSHESLVVGNGRLWILRAFHIGIAAPMLERPASTKFHILYAEESHIHYPALSQDTISLLQIIDDLCFQKMRIKG